MLSTVCTVALYPLIQKMKNCIYEFSALVKQIFAIRFAFEVGDFLDSVKYI